MTSNFFVAGAATMISDKDDWETPQALFDELDARYHFTLDPCSTHENAKCEKHFTADEDGLAQSWAGETVFCNPPYGRGIGEWVRKCAEESEHAKVVLLMPARTDTAYFHDYIYRKAKVEFIRGRLKFEVGGVATQSAPFPSMLVFFGGELMHCEIKTCYRCGADIHGDRWKLTMYSQRKPYSWKAIDWNRYYCRDCAALIMADIERGDD